MCLWKIEKINKKKENRVNSPASSTQNETTKWNNFCDLIDIYQQKLKGPLAPFKILILSIGFRERFLERSVHTS